MVKPNECNSLSTLNILQFSCVDVYGVICEIISVHLTASVAKLPAAVDVWGSWHGIANASHSDVSEGQVDDDEVGSSTELLKLHKHQQHDNVAC